MDDTPLDGKRLGKVVGLNVGGQLFTTSLATLTSNSESFFAAMFREDQMPTATDGAGNIFIDRDGTHFGVALNYLRDRQVPRGVPPDVRRALQAEAQFYQLQDLIDWSSKVDEEMQATEAAAVHIAGTCTDTITASLGSHFENLFALIQHIIDRANVSMINLTDGASETFGSSSVPVPREQQSVFWYSWSRSRVRSWQRGIMPKSMTLLWS